MSFAKAGANNTRDNRQKAQVERIFLFFCFCKKLSLIKAYTGNMFLRLRKKREKNNMYNGGLA